MSRLESRRPLSVDHSSERRDWLQHAILEADEHKNLGKKGQFLSLLADFDAALGYLHVWRGL